MNGVDRSVGDDRERSRCWEARRPCQERLRNAPASEEAGSLARRTVSVLIDAALLYVPLVCVGIYAALRSYDSDNEMDNETLVTIAAVGVIFGISVWALRMSGASPGMLLAKIRIGYRADANVKLLNQLLQRLRAYGVRSIVIVVAVLTLMIVPLQVSMAGVMLISGGSGIALPWFSLFAVGIILLDIAWGAFDKEHQTLHDKLAGTHIMMRQPGDKGWIRLLLVGLTIILWSFFGRVIAFVSHLLKVVVGEF